MFEAWGISKGNVCVILRDNASNMVKAMKDAGLPSVHTLQLAVNEGVLAQRAVIDVITIGRCIVGHFRHSPLAYSRLFDIQKENNPQQHPKQLQQDVPTRWNSTVAMLKTLLEQKRAICNYAADYDLPAIFTANHWKLIYDLAKRVSLDVVEMLQLHICQRVQFLFPFSHIYFIFPQKSL